MSQVNEVPALKQVVGALIFAAGRPLTVSEIRKCIQEVADTQGGVTASLSGVKDSNIREALEELTADMGTRLRMGMTLGDVAGGYRFQSDPACGVWIKHLLDIDKPNRLSKPALETLAIIAYRQPVSKMQIESIRGVNVDHIMKTLLELRLIRIAGRSDLPGRPFLYGTTQTFLEHFGLKDLKDLREMEPMLFAARDAARQQGAEPALVSEEDTAKEGEEKKAEGATSEKGAKTKPAVKKSDEVDEDELADDEDEELEDDEEEEELLDEDEEELEDEDEEELEDDEDEEGEEDDEGEDDEEQG